MAHPDLIPHLPDGTPIPEDALTWSFSRASGPGGQHVNKSSTRVQLRVSLERLPAKVAEALRRRCGNRIDAEGVLTVAYGGSRSQLQNRLTAARKLEELIRMALRPRKRRIPTRIPKAVKERRIQRKKQRGQVKQMRRKPGDD